MKALIIGSAGFYGSHLCAELEANGYDVIRCDIRGTEETVALDIMNPEMILRTLKKAQPDVLFNMAGQASVGLSWKEPQRTVELNTVGMINILEAVRSVNPKIRVIVIGSSDEYGSLQDEGVNVTENVPIRPITPYAISKQAQEQFAQLYISNYGLSACLVRQFNLGGAGQAKGFMLSDFASGIAEIEAGKKKHLLVGNLQSARDFIHVRDACRALRLIAEKGQSGEIYNISSGVTYKVQDILDRMIGLAKTKIIVKMDPAKMRPSDMPVVCGNHGKLTAHTGWQPELGIEQIISDELNYWRENQ